MKFVVVAVFLLACGPVTTQAQSCLTADDVRQMLTRVEAPAPATVNQKLKEDLLKMAIKQRELLQQVVEKDQSKQSDREKLHKTYESHIGKLCEMLKTNGWPTTALVDREGVMATFYILRNGGTYDLQRDLLPVILAVIKKDPMQKQEFAGLFDRLRVTAGMKQIFGTQAVSMGGFLVLYPIEDQAKVDSRREEFGLQPLELYITYFASTDVPFDLVLLIDLSGSTSDKRDLIKKSTLRFIETARPTDRLAIVTFSDTANVVSPLTLDREQLKASVATMQGMGGSNVWDAVKFTLDNVVGKKSLERRRAVVLMSDGVDGALARFGELRGSKITFADLLEQVRQTDTLIVPIYLDTESSESYGSSFMKDEYENARRTLNLLAQESGGSFYRARKISDLNGVYEQVINDLGKVYSLGYKPTNATRDGSWRWVQISILNRTDLVARTRPGYYAQ